MPVWDFYEKNEFSKLVTCKYCPKSYCMLKIANSHKALWYHLESKHSSLLLPHETPPVKKRKLSTSFQPTLHKFTAGKQKSQEQIYAEMVCKSRFTFNQVANDDFIKESMRDRGMTSHDSPQTIRKKVMEFYDDAKDSVIDELKRNLHDGKRYSLTFDEYTGNNKRFMCLNVHGQLGKRWNLGLIRVWKSQTAETLKILIELRLREFQLSWEHIVAVTTDGASIMVKLGRLLDCEHVICLSHTLHLVVGDVFYRKEKEDKQIEEEHNDNTSDIDEDEPESDLDLDGQLPLPSLPDKTTELNEIVGPVVNKIRSICCKFRKSGVKMDALRGQLKQSGVPELTVIKDCKTRWSSLCDMLERYLKLAPHIHVVLEEFKLLKMIPTDKEMSLLKEAVKSLSLLKLASTYICKQETDLETAESAIRYIEKKLEDHDGPVATALLNSLQERYHRRKNGTLVSALKFLENPNPPKDTSSYQLPSRAATTRTLKELHCRLYPNTIEKDEEITFEPSLPAIHSCIPEKKAEFDEFLDFIKKPDTSNSQSDTWSKEVNLFVSGGEKTAALLDIHSCLKTIPPTSVEAERVFSVTGLFLTKLRSRLSDVTLDKLIFLKYYFLNKAVVS